MFIVVVIYSLTSCLTHRKPASGIQYLISKGILRDTPRSVAKFLKEQNGLSKMKIGEFIGEIRYEFNMAVLEYVCRMDGEGDGEGGEMGAHIKTLGCAANIALKHPQHHTPLLRVPRVITKPLI